MAEYEGVKGVGTVYVDVEPQIKGLREMIREIVREELEAERA